MTDSIKELLREAHVKLDRAEKSYRAFDVKLDKLLEKGSGSKLDACVCSDSATGDVLGGLSSRGVVIRQCRS